MSNGWQSLAKPKGKLLASPRPLRGSRSGGTQGLRWPLAGAGLAGLLAAGFVVVGNAGQHIGGGTAPQASVAALPSPVTPPAARPAATVKPSPAQVAQPSSAPLPSTLAASPTPTQPAIAPAPPAPPPQVSAPLGYAPAPEIPPQAPPVVEQPVKTASIEPMVLPGPKPEPKPSTLGEAVARGSIVAHAETPTACIPEGLQAVLAGVAERFGEVTLVSTTRLRTNNHSQGSARHDLHSDCKAVDFKTESAVKDVMAYLRTRPEVAGVETYRNNGVIHIDTNARGAATAVARVRDGGEGTAAERSVRRSARGAAPAEAPAILGAPPALAAVTPSLAPSSGPAEVTIERGDSR